jgi:hypothetical protein
MSKACDRVKQAAMDARSNDLPATEPEDVVWNGSDFVPRELESPLDEVTLDERAANFMGERWEPRRRDEG